MTEMPQRKKNRKEYSWCNAEAGCLSNWQYCRGNSISKTFGQNHFQCQVH